MYRISTAKGSFEGSLEAVCEWQAEWQGAYASLLLPDGGEVEVHEVEFDLEDLASTLVRVRAAIADAADGGEARLVAE